MSLSLRATDRVLAELSADGATLVSLNPVRDTLEDYFVRQVTAPAHAEAPGRALAVEGSHE